MKEQETQPCNKCGKTLSLDNFCKNSHRKNGHRGICKQCDSVYHKNRLLKLKLDPSRYKVRQAIIREKARRLKGATKGATYEQKKRCRTMWKTRYPEKYAASIACSNLPKVKGENVHHWSYQQQHYKDVIFLTTATHALVHRHMVYDQERMMYRRLDGTLIDSREAAIAYYETLKDDTLEIVEKTNGEANHAG